MDPEKIVELLRTRPFTPFLLHVSAGAAYRVTHPELVLVDRRIVTVGVPGDQGLDKPLERTVHIATVHVTRLEPLPEGAQAT